MPWDTVEEAEKSVKGLKGYSAKAKRGWLKSFNSCMSDGGNDSKCFAIAYSVANRVDGKKKSSIAAMMLLRVAKDLLSDDVTMLDVPDTRQTFNYDCGAKAVQTVLAYYGIDVREDKLLKALGTTEDGTPVANIVKLLEKAGLDVKAGKTTLDELKKAINDGYPVLLPLQAWAEDWTSIDWNTDTEGHYVLVCGFDKDKNRLFFEDPSAFGKVYLSEKEFMERWHDKDDDGNVFVNFAVIVIGDKEYDSEKAKHMD